MFIIYWNFDTFWKFRKKDDEPQVEPVVARLRQFGVKSILDYSVESDISSDEAKSKAKASTAEVAPGVKFMI